MSTSAAANLFRAVSILMGLLSVLFSLLSLHYFLARKPPRLARQHVLRVTWTYIAFVSFGIVDTSSHWGQGFRWQLFGYAVVFILAINAQAPLLSYERSSAAFAQGKPHPAVPGGSQASIATTAILVILAVFSIGAGIAVLPIELRSPTFDPLRLSVQQVMNRLDGVDGPAIHLGEELAVSAVKCNISGKDIGIEGKTRWVSVDPGGTVVEGTVGSGIRPASPECPEFHYSNKLPPAVVARTEELFAEGRTSVSWTYTGIETPLGLRGAPRVWSTEVFRIVQGAS